jgi:hypothetical protein
MQNFSCTAAQLTVTGWSEQPVLHFVPRVSAGSFIFVSNAPGIRAAASSSVEN